MNLVSKSKQGAAALVSGFVVAGVLVAGALAAGSVPQGMSSQAYQALHERSQALNRAYHLGGTYDPAQSALQLRSEALNRAYGLGGVPPGSVSDALKAIRIRGDAMNAQYHLGRYTVVRAATGFDWGDAGIGAAGMLGIVLIVGGVVAGTRRFRDVRETSVPRTT